MSIMKSNRSMIKRFFPQLWVNMKFHGPRVWRRMTLLAPEKWVADGIVVAGPFVGELGFEIGEWVPHIKGLADRFKCRAHVFTKKGHEALYPFAEKIHTFDFPGGHMNCNWLMNPPEEEVERYNDLEKKVRDYAAQDEFQKKYRILDLSGRSRMFKVFRDKVPMLLEAPANLTAKWKKALPSSTKVILTFRASTRGSERNSNIDTLRRAAEFIIKKGWTPVTVGKIDDEYSIPDIVGINLINQTSLADLVAIYNLSSAVVGSSTGIIHLAAACGVPHITWGSTHSDDKIIVRYNKEWNLNNTWVRFISKEWDVSFEDIVPLLVEAVKVSEVTSQDGNLLKAD